MYILQEALHALDVVLIEAMPPKGEVQGREWSMFLGILQGSGGPRNVKFYGFDFCEK